MQFTTRNLLFALTLIAVEAAAIGRGWSLGDIQGAKAFGLAAILGLALLSLLVFRWRRERWISRVLAILVCLILLVPLFIRIEPSDEVIHRRLAQRVQGELHLQARFRGVQVRYFPRSSRPKSVAWIEANGSVATDADQLEVQQILENRFGDKLVKRIKVKVSP